MRFYSFALAVAFAAIFRASGLAVSTMKNPDRTLIEDTVSTETGRFHVDVERLLRGAEKDNPTGDDERMESGPLKEMIGSVISGTDHVGNAAPLLEKKIYLKRKAFDPALDEFDAVPADVRKQLAPLQADYRAAHDVWMAIKQKNDIDLAKMEADLEAEGKAFRAEYDAISVELQGKRKNMEDAWTARSDLLEKKIARKKISRRKPEADAWSKAEVYKGEFDRLETMITLIIKDARKQIVLKEADTVTAGHPVKQARTANGK